MNVYKNIQNYEGKKVKLRTPFSPYRPTTIHIFKVISSDIEPEKKDYDLIIYRYWANTYWKYDVINRSVLSLYNNQKN